jgi:hypothetical protein
VAADNGGYWPTSWGWATLVLCWAAALALVLDPAAAVSRWELVSAASLWLLLGWTFLSAAWGLSAPRAIEEGERTAVYAAAFLAALLVVHRRSYRALLGGAWAAIALVSGYALLTRLFPERLGTFDPLAGYRLSEPIGYWNALGVFAAIAALLGLGLAARAHSRTVVALAAASLPPLVATVYFTFSRGAWIALAAGALAGVLLDPRRLQFVTALLVVSPMPALGLAVAYRSHALNSRGASLGAASHQGHRLALVLTALAVANALLVLGLRAFGRRISMPAVAVRAYGLGLIIVVAAGLTLAFARWGSPATIAQRAYDSFKGPAVVTTGSLNRRLFNLSGNGRLPQWRVAWRESEAHPLLGSGAGTYEFAWDQFRPYAAQVRDAHNLYLEMLAELGPVGLALLVIALGAPLVAAARARRHALVPFALGAYVVFLVHAVVDWDWEIPAVTLCGLFCAAALLVAARGEAARALGRADRGVGMAFVVALALFALVGVVGNRALASAGHAATANEWRSVDAKADTAAAWAPWSAQPWQLRAESQLAHRRLAAARASYRKAIARDSHDWTLWFGLAQASSGRSRREALAAAHRLNPRSPEIAEFETSTGIGSGQP